ncbi:MAG: uracil-DNA glycosylase [Anaerolineales bacterium]|nr:uracil-DNA glycosylase [Anaerolineales bacterium]
MNPEDIIKEVAEEVSTCTMCELHHSRKLAVPGEGPVNSDIMFIGEGPGFHENEQGRPFVGAAGKFLEELLSDIGLSREEVFISNVVKCRPPGNRDPLPEEVETCTSTYLDRQIQAIDPKVIVTLGRFSMNLLLPNAKISQVHGQPVKIRGRLVMPMYHPAAALHNGSLRPVIQQDFSKLPELIAAAADSPKSEENKKKYEDEPKQLSLF